MSQDGDEAEDLASLGGSLVINMGTATTPAVDNYLKALKAYNNQGGPVLLDPVGAGATKVRRRNLQRLLAGGSFDVIKGNESEIQTVLGSSDVQQKGVDSSSDLDDAGKVEVVKALALARENVVVLTGKTDYLSDGHRTVRVMNGHQLLGAITGSGCALGTTVAACLAVEKEDKLLAALAGVLLYTVAAERAVSAPRKSLEGAPDANAIGPGTFVPAFIDSLSNLALSVERDLDAEHWLGEADFGLAT